MWINDILAWTTKADDFHWPHPWPLTFTVGAEGEPVFAKDHIHPLTVPTDKKCPLRLPRVTAADPQDLLEMRSSQVLMITHESAKTRMRTALNNWILYVLISLAEKTTCIGWQMRLRVGVSPGLVFSGRRLSSRPSNIPLSLPALSLGPQLKNEWELQWRRADTSIRFNVFLYCRVVCSTRRGTFKVCSYRVINIGRYWDIVLCAGGDTLGTKSLT